MLITQESEAIAICAATHKNWDSAQQKCKSLTMENTVEMIT